MGSLFHRSFLSLLLLAPSLYFLSACNSGDRSKETITASQANPDCFRFVQGRDTIDLSIIETDGKIKGRLAFRFYEKDKSTGTLDGIMKGDTLFANYSFTSEGTLSNREVAFKKVGNAFSMGSGEILNSGSTDIIKDPNALEFSETVILRNVDCDSSRQFSTR